MSLINQAPSHYSIIRKATPRKLEIPAWEKDGVAPVVYIRAHINLRQTAEILHLTQTGKEAEAFALTLIYRLMDEEGKRVFRLTDKDALIDQTDPEVLSDIINAINSDDNEDEDEIEKK